MTVNVTNEGDLEATVHWHGVRLENRFDGTHDTQAPIPVGDTFTYQLHVPDPGAYWYHPHIREDYGQEMGLYGNIHVVPAEPEYWPSRPPRVVPDPRRRSRRGRKDRRLQRLGDDTCRDGPLRQRHARRRGASLALTARRGEVVRFFFTNTANTRVFNVALPGIRMKLVGGDSGHYEREGFVEEVLLSPSERVAVDVLFEHPGEHVLEHRTPARSYRLASITVTDDAAEPALGEHFDHTPDQRRPCSRKTANRPIHWDAAPDKTLAFVAEMDFDTPEAPSTRVRSSERRQPKSQDAAPSAE